MPYRYYILIVMVCCLGLSNSLQAQTLHSIYYCGESIPMDKDFVSNKLMNVIKKQVPLVNLPQLRERARSYFPIIERYLKEHGLPEDLKYIPIVESGFISFARSQAGAKGFWQFMPATAAQYGLVITPSIDEREDIFKSSKAACKLLRDYYNFIFKNRNVASWVLTCAAYNYGIGNINNAIKKQGSNYFNMDLNEETALYVYKIIAVKELFEYPEVYMKNFGYNVFNPKASKTKMNKGDDNEASFKHLEVASSDNKKTPKAPKIEYEYILAHIDKIGKNFEDGNLITIKLDENLSTKIKFASQGQSYSVPGWIIDGKIMADIGFGRDVVICDLNQEKGVSLESLQNQKRTNVLLKNVVIK
jgi:membrane-bound lytic murein transglycosylase D